MMVMSNLDVVTAVESPDGYEIITSSNDETHDEAAVQAWRAMWIESGCAVDELAVDINKMTRRFIKQARGELGLQYQTVIARDVTSGTIVGSLSTMIWQGDTPIKTNDTSVGTVWGVRVNPSHRRRGVGFAMMQACCMHWKACGCSKGVLIYASEEGRRVYERIGFVPHSQYDHELEESTGTAEVVRAETSVMVRDLKEKLSQLDNDGQATGHFSLGVGLDLSDDLHLHWLVMALPRQLEAVFGPSVNVNDEPDEPAPLTAPAVSTFLHSETQERRLRIWREVVEVQRRHGTYVDPKNNWFTQNLKRFGRGFDMQQLAADPQKLATKFDRLATKYDQWATGNVSKVEHWLAKRARAANNNQKGTLVCFDISCGIGLPAHTLRLCGLVNARIIGTDISAGMVEQAKCRQVYDETFLCDANCGFRRELPESGCVDLVVCTGAMELLNHGTVLAEIARLLKPGSGKAWLTFQWEDPRWEGAQHHPTLHQNVRGVSQEECVVALHKAGMVLASVEKCRDAFYTPSPRMDGTLNAVPYLFVEAEMMLVPV
eukprot:CAMPEP_0185773538 /NCGR_PEP_ID=MMETSP1174-20130828/73984_1 /TAXON_ID=35687 /ORGANISM="Dictyocha speculum, Strain CCMP1381" /LENGTH=544 /DNA_ID=CAMNT_0028460281 /DNA_START=63 /DNA_END=1697 /DNA_ORIENTATION=-